MVASNLTAFVINLDSRPGHLAEFARFILEQPSFFDGTFIGHDNYIRHLSLETEFKNHCYVHHPNLAAQSQSTSDLGKDPQSVNQEPHGMKEWRRILP